MTPTLFLIVLLEFQYYKTETVPPDVQPRRNATAGGTILIGGDPPTTASHWRQKQIFFRLLSYSRILPVPIGHS